MPTKVVVIGSNGLLGQTLVNKLSNEVDYSLSAMASGKNRNAKAPNLHYFQIDIADFESIKIQLNLLEPDFVINALAMTNVDACETERDLCDLINIDFVTALAQFCNELKTHLIHISTDFIFDGVKGMYSEADEASPVNYYGLSKLKSERKIKGIIDNYTILRTILVYGKVANMKRSNLVLWVKKSLEKGESIHVVNDQYRMLTYVGSLADACILTMEKKAKGVFHVSGNELLSIYDIALQIADFFDISKSLIQPIDSRELSQKAKRPPKTGFILEKSIEKLGFRPLSVAQGLTLFQNDL